MFFLFHHWWGWLVLALWITLGLKMSYEKLSNEETLKRARNLREIERIEEENKYTDMRIAALTKGKPPWA